MSVDPDTGDNSYESSEISLPRPIRFWLLLILDVLSIICTLVVLFHLIGQRKLRQSISNHVIIILLVFGLATQLIDVPFYLAFIAHHGLVVPSTPAICLVWWFAALAMYNGGTVLMAWAAFERHIVVFHSGWTLNRRGRLLVHYLPLLTLILYIFVFYIYVFLIFACDNPYEYRLPQCNASPCYQADPFLGLWDFVGNNILPSLLVALFSGVLIIRVIRQKRRLHQQIQWRKQRRMIIQLVAISALNIVINVPLNLVGLARFCGLPKDYGVAAQLYFYFSCYFLIFLFPFVCLFSYPEIVRKIPLMRLCRKNRQNMATMPSMLFTNG